MALGGLHRLSHNCQFRSILAGVGWNISELALGGAEWPPKNFQSQFWSIQVIIPVVSVPLPVSIPDQPRFMAIMCVGEREHATPVQKITVVHCWIKNPEYNPMRLTFYMVGALTFFHYPRSQ